MFTFMKVNRYQNVFTLVSISCHVAFPDILPAVPLYIPVIIKAIDWLKVVVVFLWCLERNMSQYSVMNNKQ